jgi:hypothetical protein
MSVFGPRAQSRSTTLLLVAAVHGLIFWGIWRVRAPVAQEVETFASVMFFVPKAASQHTLAATTPGAVRGSRASRARRSLPSPPQQPQRAESATAITLPATPSARIDWSGQLAGIAQAELDKEAKARTQLSALTRRFELQPDPRNPGPATASTFRWYQAGIHHIDTRGSLPVLVLNDHCVMLMFIIPFCRIGHIESHGDLFDNAARVHDERLATPGPNEVP